MTATGGKREGAGRKPGVPNKATAYIRELASQHAEAAIQTLVDMMESDDTPAAVKVSASRELIERGFGKSGNYVDLKLDTPLSELSPADAITTIADKTTSGVISTEDGQRLTGLIESRIKAIEIEQLAVRLAKLEEKSQ